MIFIFGPLASGKRTVAKRLLGCGDAELPERAVLDAQELAREGVDLEALAGELAQREAVLATEVGSGVVPLDPEEREARERAGRLGQLLSERAETVVRVFCGIPICLKGGPLPAAAPKDGPASGTPRTAAQLPPREPAAPSRPGAASDSVSLPYAPAAAPDRGGAPC